MRKYLLAPLALLPLVIAGCSALPIPVNLLPYLGSNVQGSQVINVPPLSDQVFSEVLPKSSGLAFNFKDANFPSLTSARFQYSLNLSWSGTASVSGQVTAQLYLAPAGTTNPAQKSYALGEPINLDLSAKGQNVLSGEVILDAAQLKAVNDRSVVVAVLLNGSQVSSSGGTVNVGYKITQLTLYVGIL